MAYNDIHVERDEGIVVLTLNRPRQINSLSLRLMEESLLALDEVRADPEARVLIVRAAGKHFCSGHDIAEMRGKDLPTYRRIFDTCTRLMDAIQELPQPVIAQVHGVATAAGCQLVATCDLAVAEEGARFATPGVKIGFFCTTPMVALSRAIGRKKAMEMLLTGDYIDAHEACSLGLVNKVVSPNALEEETLALARKVAAASPFVLGLGKQAFYAQEALPQPLAYAYAKEVISMNAVSEDAQEGFAAFLEKRAPTWKGK